MTKPGVNIARHLMRPVGLAGVSLMVTAVGVALASTSHADNKRLNDSLVANVYTVQHQAGCTNDVRISPPLQLAAEWHARDVLNNRALDGDTGSDGSSPQDRSNAAGYKGHVQETVAINPALAISSSELINRWYHDPGDLAVMSNCANSQIGVWSENSPDRTVVVAVYGQPQNPPQPSQPDSRPHALGDTSDNVPLDPTPDYDASDELEYGIDWFAWILRGQNPPPAYPPK